MGQRPNLAPNKEDVDGKIGSKVRFWRTVYPSGNRESTGMLGKQGVYWFPSF